MPRRAQHVHALDEAVPSGPSPPPTTSPLLKGHNKKRPRAAAATMAHPHHTAAVGDDDNNYNAVTPMVADGRGSEAAQSTSSTAAIATTSSIVAAPPPRRAIDDSSLATSSSALPTIEFITRGAADGATVAKKSSHHQRGGSGRSDAVGPRDVADLVLWALLPTDHPRCPLAPTWAQLQGKHRLTQVVVVHLANATNHTFLATRPDTSNTNAVQPSSKPASTVVSSVGMSGRPALLEHIKALPGAQYTRFWTINTTDRLDLDFFMRSVPIRTLPQAAGGAAVGPSAYTYGGTVSTGETDADAARTTTTTSPPPQTTTRSGGGVGGALQLAKMLAQRGGAVATSKGATATVASSCARHHAPPGGVVVESESDDALHQRASGYRKNPHDNRSVVALVAPTSAGAGVDDNKTPSNDGDDSAHDGGAAASNTHLAQREGLTDADLSVWSAKDTPARLQKFLLPPDLYALHGFVSPADAADGAGPHSGHDRWLRPPLAPSRLASPSDSPRLSSSLVPKAAVSPRHGPSVPNAGNAVGGSPKSSDSHVAIERIAPHAETAAAAVAPPLRVVAMDCEMVLTVEGSALARLTVLHCPSGRVELDVYVRPALPIIDYVTAYSGIEPHHMDAAVTLREAQRRFMNIVCPRAAGPVPSHPTTTTTSTTMATVIGHSLENDFRALRIDPREWGIPCIDTTHLFPHPNGLPAKNALRFLTQMFLSRRIQQRDGGAGHDPREDALAAMDLTTLKLSRGGSFGLPARENFLRWLQTAPPTAVCEPTTSATSVGNNNNHIATMSSNGVRGGSLAASPRYAVTIIDRADVVRRVGAGPSANLHAVTRDHDAAKQALSALKKRAAAVAVANATSIQFAATATIGHASSSLVGPHAGKSTNVVSIGASDDNSKGFLWVRLSDAAPLPPPTDPPTSEVSAAEVGVAPSSTSMAMVPSASDDLSEVGYGAEQNTLPTSEVSHADAQQLRWDTLSARCNRMVLASPPGTLFLFMAADCRPDGPGRFQHGALLAVVRPPLVGDDASPALPATPEQVASTPPPSILASAPQVCAHQ